MLKYNKKKYQKNNTRKILPISILAREPRVPAVTLSVLYSDSLQVFSVASGIAFLTREYAKRNERVIGMDGKFT